jgi:hypothetical protein
MKKMPLKMVALWSVSVSVEGLESKTSTIKKTKSQIHTQNMKDADGTMRYGCMIVETNISGEEKKCACREYSNNQADNRCEVCDHLAVHHTNTKTKPVWLMYNLCLKRSIFICYVQGS